MNEITACRSPLLGDLSYWKASSQSAAPSLDLIKSTNCYYYPRASVVPIGVFSRIGKIIKALFLLILLLWQFIVHAARASTVKTADGIQHCGANYKDAKSRSDLFRGHCGRGNLISLLQTVIARNSGVASSGPQFTLTDAQAIGMRFTDEERTSLRGSHCRIAPYIIPYGGQHNFWDRLNCEDNLSNCIPPNLIESEKELLGILLYVRAHNEEVLRNDKGVFWCPVLGGHSMGAMIAHALAAKHRLMSFGFNPFGLGRGVELDFVGKDLMALANGAEAASHISIIVRGDWVSDPTSASSIVHRPPPGERFLIPCVLDVEGIRKKKKCSAKDALHCSICENVREFLAGAKATAETSS
jgi:hypothetical protein